MLEKIASSIDTARSKIGMAACGFAAVAIPVLDITSDTMQSMMTTFMPLIITFAMLGVMTRMIGNMTGK